MLEASVTGLLRTIFIIIGILAALRFLGQVIQGRREKEKLNAIEREKAALKKAKLEQKRNLGKTFIQQTSDDSDLRNTIDVDYEES